MRSVLTFYYSLRRRVAAVRPRSAAAAALCGRTRCLTAQGRAPHRLLARAGLVRSAAGTYAPHGLRINCVAPGLVDATRQTEKFMGGKVKVGEI